MIVPPGMPKMTSTPSSFRHRLKICDPFNRIPSLRRCWVLGDRSWRVRGWRHRPSPNTYDPKPRTHTKALACSGRGPLAVPPGLTRSAHSYRRHSFVPRCQGDRGRTRPQKNPRPTGTRATRGTTLVDAASRRIHSWRGIVRQPVLGYWTAPVMIQVGGSLRPLRGELRLLVGPGSHLPPAL